MGSGKGGGMNPVLQSQYILQTQVDMHFGRASSFDGCLWIVHELEEKLPASRSNHGPPKTKRRDVDACSLSNLKLRQPELSYVALQRARYHPPVPKHASTGTESNRSTGSTVIYIPW